LRLRLRNRASLKGRPLLDGNDFYYALNLSLSLNLNLSLNLLILIFAIMKHLACIFSLLVFSFCAYSQTVATNPDTVLMNNGKVIVAQVVDTLGGDITVIDLHTRKHKKVELSKEGVFSIRFGSTGKEELFYVYDTLVGNDFTVDDARKFIAGEQDAERGYHAVGVSVGAFVVGFASGAAIGSIFAFGPPFLYDGIMTYPAIHVRHKSVRNMKIADSDPYLYGYYLTASRKRMLRSFLWSGVGLVSGLIANQILLNNQ